MELVICNKAHVCDERSECEHAEPHEVQEFGWGSCKDFDTCLERRVRCIPYIPADNCVDFEIDKLFFI